MLTDVRQRVQHEQQGRRGMKVDPAWAHRRLLQRAGNELSPKALTRLKTVSDTDDPTNEISAAWVLGAPCSDAPGARPERVSRWTGYCGRRGQRPRGWDSCGRVSPSNPPHPRRATGCLERRRVTEKGARACGIRPRPSGKDARVIVW
jgi:hypothetical protein